ncbi:hypothetical protein [Bacillus xiapuensis]|uniref:hypothetical protein n=1 Tax=Bacillus xiapuensis TaxID=2014075 RepID=UPI000C24DBB8|nr:hypothetical protein [Bacillus xiapuensis]
MKLHFQEQVIEFDNDTSVEEIIEKINDLLGDQYYFDHLVVNHEKILESPEVVLSNRLPHIETIEVMAVPAKEFINDLLLSAEEYTARALPHIAALADRFYNHPDPSCWQELNQLFEGIQWLLLSAETIDQSVVRPANWEKVLASLSDLKGELGNLEEALENIDTVLIADMLQYEIEPVFETMAKEVKMMIDREGMRHDLN